MDLNAISLTSWERLRQLLETADCVRQSYRPASAACIMNTSDAHLLQRSLFFKKKHTFTKQSTLITRLGVIDKDMKAYALALYKAWEAIPVLQSEYLAILEVQNEKAASKTEREEDNKERIDDLEDAAARTRRRVNKKLARRAQKEIDLGEAGGAEDDADALEDERAERQVKKAQTKADAEQKEEERLSEIRTYVVTAYTIEQASKLLPLLKNLNSREAEAFLRTVHNEKHARKTPPPPPVVQPIVSSSVPAPVPSFLHLPMLDHDSYDEPSIGSSESESDGSVSLSYSPGKEQRMNELSSSMSSVNLVATQNV